MKSHRITEKKVLFGTPHCVPTCYRLGEVGYHEGKSLAQLQCRLAKHDQFSARHSIRKSQTRPYFGGTQLDQVSSQSQSSYRQVPRLVY